MREWLERVGVKTLSIEPGSPWENGYVESFNGKLRDELLAREVFDTLLEAKVLIERWRKAYNTVRPHSSLGYRPPAPESRRPCRVGPGAFAPRPLTEPDLWVTHPALWVPFSQVEQQRLARGPFARYKIGSFGELCGRGVAHAVRPWGRGRNGAGLVHRR